MKIKFIQKMMVGAFAVALAVMPVMSANASNPSAGSNPSSGTTGAVEAVITSSSGGAVSSVAEVPVTSNVAGVKTTIRGVYLATSVNGSVITTSLAAIAGDYGLTTGETPYARIYNMDTKKSYLAAAVIDQAAAAKGAVVGPYVNVELGKLSGGKFGLLSTDGAPITVSFGIPASFAQTDKTFAVVCVRPGGAVSILEDTDSNPNTVTFNTTGGQGACRAGCL